MTDPLNDLDRAKGGHAHFDASTGRDISQQLEKVANSEADLLGVGEESFSVGPIRIHCQLARRIGDSSLGHPLTLVTGAV